MQSHLHEIDDISWSIVESFMRVTLEFIKEELICNSEAVNFSSMT